MDRKNAVELPAAKDVPSKAPLTVQPGQLPHEAGAEAMPNVEDGVAVVKTRQRLVHGEAFGCSVGSRGAAVPSRALIERVRPDVVGVQLHAVAHALVDHHLQGVVVGVDRVFPNAQTFEQAVDAYLPRGGAPRITGARGIVSLDAAERPVDVLGAVKLMAEGPDP